MSEDLNDQPLTQDPLVSLKARADLMGVAYHPNIGLDKLREKVSAALAGKPAEKDDAAAVQTVVLAPGEPVPETPGQRKARLKKDANELIRIRLTCMNPAKKDWAGEIITVGNALVGSFKKYIPFNADEGWHVPKIIYQQLVSRQCQIFTTLKSKNGVSVRQGKLIKEFAIEVLPKLTGEELRDLAQRQAMAGTVGT